jgi:hypothetical protein
MGPEPKLSFERMDHHLFLCVLCELCVKPDLLFVLFRPFHGYGFLFMTNIRVQNGLDRPHLYAVCITNGPDYGHDRPQKGPQTTPKADFCLQNQRDKL